MEKLLFINSENSVLLAKQAVQHKRNETDRKMHFKPYFFLLLIFCIVGFALYLHKTKTTKAVQQTQQTQNSRELETLIQKAISKEELTEQEWSELCELLSTEKGMNIKDCENCRVYIRAKLGGKHSRWYEDYKRLPETNIRKGIRSISKEIQLHVDKINNPKKYYPQLI